MRLREALIASDRGLATRSVSDIRGPHYHITAYADDTFYYYNERTNVIREALSHEYKDYHDWTPMMKGDKDED